MAKKVDPTKLVETFEEMMIEDEANRYCADCRAKGKQKRRKQENKQTKKIFLN